MSSSGPTPQPSVRRLTASIAGNSDLFEPGLDLGVLERMLLALSTHADGCGFERAHLLVWNPDRKCLEGRLGWKGVAGESLATILLEARRQGSQGTDTEASRFVRGLSLDPSDLEAPLVKAWASRRTWLGRPRDDPPRPWGVAHRIGVVPLDGPRRPFGLLVGEWTTSGSVAARAQALESLRILARSALAAQALSRSTALAEQRFAAVAQLARAATSSLNVAEVANLLVRLAAVTTGARGSVLWRVPEGTENGPVPLEFTSTYGPAGTRERIGRGLAPLATRCVADEKRCALERAVESPLLSPDVASQISSAAAVPLAAYGRTSGALVVYDRGVHHPNESTAFDEQDLVLLEALAAQCALAFEQARIEGLRQRLERSRQDLLRDLGRSERLAAQGELSARAAREARNPLAAIGAFARRVHRGLAADDPQREYLEVVIREAERVERALALPLPLETTPGPRFMLESVNTLLQKALQRVGERLVRRRVRLLKKLAPDLPPLLLDVVRMSHVVENVLDHALERVSSGGRIRVESRRQNQFVVVEIAHDGSLQPGQALAEVFVPFALGGEGAGGVGLGLARQVVREHGGEVRARSEGEWSIVFSLTLPIRENEDRRKCGSDRRVTRSDRRQRVPVD